MAINFLQSLQGQQKPPLIPAYSMPQQVQPRPLPSSNIATRMGGPQGGNVLQMAQEPASNAPAQTPAGEAPRKRRSLLDTIGGISDVLARVGGAEAMYQPTLDAREDRAQQIDLDALRKQILEQQATVGGQTIEANEAGAADDMRSRAAQALGALAGNPNAAAMWPQIAQQAGLDEQSTATLGNIIQADPNNIGTLAQALGYAAPKQGSQAKELQVYSLLQEQDPELAQTYLRSIANPESLTPYDRARLEISMAELNLKREEAQFDRGIAERETDLKEEKAAGGGVDLTPTQRGNVVQKLALLPNVRAQYERVRTLYDEMVQEGTLARGGVGGLVPGALAGGKAEAFDKAAGALRKSILSLTRIPGVGSMSNYETVLDEQALPTRWGSDEGRLEALNGIGTVLDSYEQGYKEMLGNPAARAATPRRGGTGERVRPRLPARTRPSAAGRNPAVEAELRRRGLID